MTPSQKAFIDAHLDIFAACKDCMARVSSFVKNGSLPTTPAAVEVKRTATHVCSTIGLDERYRRQIAPSTRVAAVWDGLCTCGRRWRYSQPHLHALMGRLEVGLRPEPVASKPSEAKQETEAPAVDPWDGPAGAQGASQPAMGQTVCEKPAVQPATSAPTTTMPTLGQLRARVATRLPFVNAPKRQPYFASMYRHDESLRHTLSHRKGSFILLLKTKKSAHKHPPPLERPELQNTRARAFDEAFETKHLPALLEVHTEYFDESVIDGLCCLDVGVLVSADGCLYRTLSAASYDKETPGGFAVAMPDVPGTRRGVDPEALRAQVADEFPGIVNEPARTTKESGVCEGRTTDVLAERGLGRRPIVLAVEWSTLNYSVEHCPHGRNHPPIMQRPGVRDWIRHSTSTTGFVTRKNEPMLIAMRSAPMWLDEELCCVSVRVLVPGVGTSFHRFAPGKVRWETR